MSSTDSGVTAMKDKISESQSSAETSGNPPPPVEAPPVALAAPISQGSLLASVTATGGPGVPSKKGGTSFLLKKIFYLHLFSLSPLYSHHPLFFSLPILSCMNLIRSEIMAKCPPRDRLLLPFYVLRDGTVPVDVSFQRYGDLLSHYHLFWFRYFVICGKCCGWLARREVLFQPTFPLLPALLFFPSIHHGRVTLVVASVCYTGSFFHYQIISVLPLTHPITMLILTLISIRWSSKCPSDLGLLFRFMSRGSDCWSSLACTSG